MAKPQAEANKTLFNDPIFSNITIRQICNGQTKEYHAHKAVLCGHSKWFFNAFLRGFKESSDRVIELHEDNPEHFAILLQYLYTFEYTSGVQSKGVWEETWAELIGVHALADKYDVPKLKTITSKEFSNNAPWAKSSLVSDKVDPMIQMHYEKCNEVDGSMGRAIIEYLSSGNRLEDMRGWVQFSFDKLVKEYPVFGADLAFYAQKHKKR